jgi:uncharacterized FAD-dependent dehydrogenase
MRVRIRQLDLPPEYTPAQLLKAAAKQARCTQESLSDVVTVRRSVDAREQSPRMNVIAEATLSGALRNGMRDVERVKPLKPHVSTILKSYSGPHPVVVGAGPAGLMAAFALAESGMNPLLIERGDAAAQRSERVEAFWKEGSFNAESNVLYGEGGAGLFSDGKLTSRSKDRIRARRVLEVLVECGASPDILIDAEPHIGSDVLEELVPALRRKIIDLGGEVRFGARLDRIEIEKGAVRGVVIAGEELRTDSCVLAAGHSARDIYEMLAEQNVPLESKAFAVGLRLEMPQDRIDVAQWGQSLPSLGKASFRATRREGGDSRACYTFCMCPGGMVIACASSEGRITTNGMSLSGRDRPMGNAAFLVPVLPTDYPEVRANALAGIEFQKKLESAAFVAGGSDYSLPAQRLVDYLEGNPSTDLPKDRSCTRAIPAQLRGQLPGFVETTLRSAIPKMLRGMRGVVLDEALLYASETRSSSPVRVVRDKDGQSAIHGLYPSGEGSGYAGGIVSSAIDGLRSADMLVQAKAG